MSTLELVCKRLLDDSSCVLRCAFGAVLLAVPGAHFAACG